MYFPRRPFRAEVPRTPPPRGLKGPDCPGLSDSKGPIIDVPLASPPCPEPAPRPWPGAPLFRGRRSSQRSGRSFPPKKLFYATPPPLPCLLPPTEGARGAGQAFRARCPMLGIGPRPPAARGRGRQPAAPALGEHAVILSQL